MASYEATADAPGSAASPADYRVVLPGADAPPARRPRRDGAASAIAFVDDEERAALRALPARAAPPATRRCRGEATVVTARGPSSSTPLRADAARAGPLRGPGDGEDAGAARGADVARRRLRRRRARARRCCCARSPPAPSRSRSRLPVYEELLGDGERGLLFEPGDADDARRAARAPASATRRCARALRARPAPLRERLSWTRVADELEAVYARARRAPPRRPRRPGAAPPVAARRLIDVDLHMHTDHSQRLRDAGRGAARDRARAGPRARSPSPTTTRSRARSRRARRPREFGVKVIVGEEVKTADQGEVIGLFLKEKIPRGLTLEETVAEIKRQGGLVYVPHPFDRMHSVPDYEHLLGDPRRHRRDRGLQPARRDRRVQRGGRALRGQVPDRRAGAGSDCARRPGPRLGADPRCATSTARRSSSSRCARPTSSRKPASLLYVQALKFLETKATPAGARAPARRGAPGAARRRARR